MNSGVEINISTIFFIVWHLVMFLRYWLRLSKSFWGANTLYRSKRHHRKFIVIFNNRAHTAKLWCQRRGRIAAHFSFTTPRRSTPCPHEVLQIISCFSQKLLSNNHNVRIVTERFMFQQFVWKIILYELFAFNWWNASRFALWCFNRGGEEAFTQIRTWSRGNMTIW